MIHVRRLLTILQPTSHQSIPATLLITAMMMTILLGALTEAIEIPCSSHAAGDALLLVSNYHYTLTDCFLSSSPSSSSTNGDNDYIRMALSGGIDGGTCDNVTVVVVRGNVLPVIGLDANSRPVSVTRLSVIVHGVRHSSAMQLPTNEWGIAVPRQLAIIGLSSVFLQQVSSVSLVLENTTSHVAVDAIAAAVSAPARYRSTFVSLVAINTGNDIAASTTRLAGLWVDVRNSNLTMRVNNTVSLVNSTLGAWGGGYRASMVVVNCENEAIDVRVSTGSHLAVVANSAAAVPMPGSQQPTWGAYSSVNPSIASVRCEDKMHENLPLCKSHRFRFVADDEIEAGDGAANLTSRSSSSLTVSLTTSGYSLNNGIATGIVERPSIVDLSYLASLSNVVVEISGVVVHADAVCVSYCSAQDLPPLTDTTSSLITPTTRVRVVDMDGHDGVGIARNISVVIFNVRAMISAALAAVAVSLSTMHTVTHTAVYIISSNFTIESVDLNAASTRAVSKRQSLFEVAGVDNATFVTTVVRDVHAVHTCANGSSTLMLVAAVSFVGNISRSNVTLGNVVMSVFIGNGSAASPAASIPLFSAAVLSILTSLVSVAPQSPSSMTVAHELVVSISNSTIAASHTCDLPQNASLVFVVSVMSALSVSRSLEHAFLLLSNVHVLRKFPTTAGPLSWFPVTGTYAHFNVTALMNLLDMTGALSTALAIAPIASALLGGASVNIVHQNVSTTIKGNSTVTCDARLRSLATDSQSHIHLPTVSNSCTYLIQHSWNPSFSNDNGGSSSAPAVFGAIGTVRLQDSHLTVLDVAGVSMLLFANMQAMQIHGATTFRVDNVSVVAAEPPLLPMHRFVVGADSATIDVSPTPLATHPTFLFERASFQGFSSVIMASALNIVASTFVFEFGCNLWIAQDGTSVQTLTLSNVAGQRFAAAAAPIVKFLPNTSFNSTLECNAADDVPSLQTTTPSATISLLFEAPPIELSSKAFLAMTTAAMTYGTLMTGNGGSGGRGAVPALQRAMSALRLAARCRGDADEEDDDDENVPMFGALVDNPLSAAIPMGGHPLISLDHAAGAAVVNLALVCGIAHLLHMFGCAQRWFSKQQHRQDANAPLSSTPCVVRNLMQWAFDVLPSAGLPGSIAVPFGTLLQPSVAACVALMMMATLGLDGGDSQRSHFSSTQPVLCGALMLVLWLVFPLLCCHEVLWRGRVRAAGKVRFVLRSVSVVPALRRHRRAGSRGEAKLQTSLCGFLRRIAVVAVSTSNNLMKPLERWVPRSSVSLRGTAGRRVADCLLRNMEAVFGGYVHQREWYFVVDWAFAIASGVVLGASEAMSVITLGESEGVASACDIFHWSTGASIALGALYVVLCAWLRPLTVKLEQWTGVVLCAVGVLCEVLLLAAGGKAVNKVVERIVSWAAVVELAVAVVLMLNGIRWVSEQRKFRLAETADDAKHSSGGPLLPTRDVGVEQRITLRKQRPSAAAKDALPTSTAVLERSSQERNTLTEEMTQKRLRWLVNRACAKNQRTKRTIASAANAVV